MKFRERVSVVCLHNDQILCFDGLDPQSQQQYYFIPGGGIETGETKSEAAIRETMEETGYAVEILEETCVTRRYPFRWNGAVFDCLTHFYLGHLTGPWKPPGPVQDQDYNRNPCWRDLRNLGTDFGYSKEIFEAIAELVDLAKTTKKPTA